MTDIARVEGRLERTEEFLIELPIAATFQPDEVADAQKEAIARRVPLRRVLFERAVGTAVEVLRLGGTQYAGALVVVESRRRYT